MFHSKQAKRWAAFIGVASVGLSATVALASAGSGITAENFVTAQFNANALVNHDRVKFQTKDPTDVRVQKLTFAAGARSGWHHHPGLVMVAVQSGLVTLTDSICGSTTYGPGSLNGAVFVEGNDDAMEASSTAGAVAYVTVVVPRGEPARIEDDVPLCATQLPATRRR